jgi:hypothetical protein
MAKFKNYRIDGIERENISKEIVYFSNIPGENDDDLILEVDNHDSENESDSDHSCAMHKHDEKSKTSLN